MNDKCLAEVLRDVLVKHVYEKCTHAQTDGRAAVYDIFMSEVGIKILTDALQDYDNERQLANEKV